MTKEKEKEIRKAIDDHLEKHDMSADHSLEIMLNNKGENRGVYQIEEHDDGIHVTFELTDDSPGAVVGLVIPL